MPQRPQVHSAALRGFCPSNSSLRIEGLSGTSTTWQPWNTPALALLQAGPSSEPCGQGPSPGHRQPGELSEPTPANLKLPTICYLPPKSSSESYKPRHPIPRRKGLLLTWIWETIFPSLPELPQPCTVSKLGHQKPGIIRAMRGS